MPHMDYGQIEITTNGNTDTRYETCGYDNCTHIVLGALGVGDERFTDRDTFDLIDDENTITVTVRSYMDEQDSCTWCYGCGDFLVHGLSCDCKERGHDPDVDREPMRPMVEVNGRLELRPF